jgi:hypothetical protein
VLAVADVQLDLAELTVLPADAPGRVGVRFPEARYLGGPPVGRRPAQSAHWSLSGTTLITAADPAGQPAGPS